VDNYNPPLILIKKQDMKNNFVTTAILLICYLTFHNIYAQQISIEAFKDSNNTEISDRVIIGFISMATIGIDSKLGETDITNEPINEFSLRVIQRDENSYDCMVDTAGNNLIYSNHIESKVDLRSPNNFDIRNSYFEIAPNGIFEGGFSLDLSNYHSQDAPKSYLNLATKTECEDSQFSFFLALGDPKQFPFHISEIVLTPFDVNFLDEPYAADIPYFTKLYVHMEQDILNSTSTTEGIQKSGIAFPNPTNGNTTLDWCGRAEVCGINGQILQSDNSDDCTKNLILEHLPAGAYFIKLFNQQSAYRMTIKIIKL